jgi:riboflavin synthase
MFSGIIQTIGEVTNIEKMSGGAKFTFTTHGFFAGSKVGDSIASNGVCLTIIWCDDNSFSADLSNETLSLTTFATSKVGDRVNFEKSLTLSQGIDGHLVSGHIDGMAEIITKTPSGDNTIFAIKSPQPLSKYIAQKGSITLNGISLTVNDIQDDVFTINIVPHTLSVTNFDDYKSGDFINIEVDIIARHLERLLESRA